VKYLKRRVPLTSRRLHWAVPVPRLEENGMVFPSSLRNGMGGVRKGVFYVDTGAEFDSVV